MNLNQVKQVLPYLFKHNVVGNLIGIHGVGKSTSVREYTEEKGIGFVDLRLGQMEVGDLLGLPEIIDDKDGNKVTVFARPAWFPTEGKGILFLDEWNRAKRDVTQAIFQLVLDRRLNQYVLPEGWHVVCAMNPDTEDFNVLELSDKALLDRFCHIKISSSYTDFIEYSGTKGVNKSVLNFISAHPGMLRSATAEFNLKFVTPSDRSWSIAARFVDDKEISDDLLNEIMTGLVGLEAATAFLAYKKKAEKPVDGMLVLSDYAKVQQQIQDQCKDTNYRADLVNETKNQILDYLKSKKEGEELTQVEYDNLVAFMIDLPNDLFISLSKDCMVCMPVFIKLSEEKRFWPKIDAAYEEEKAEKTEDKPKKRGRKPKIAPEDDIK